VGVKKDSIDSDKWPTEKKYADAKLWNENVHVMPGFASHWNKNGIWRGPSTRGS